MNNSSKTKICINNSVLQFNTVEQLIEYCVHDNGETEFLNVDELIKFPDGDYSSSTMIEARFQPRIDLPNFVHPQVMEHYTLEILIGVPARFNAYRFDDWRYGLRLADKLAKDWITRKSEWDLDRYLDYVDTAIECGVDL